MGKQGSDCSAVSPVQQTIEDPKGKSIEAPDYKQLSSSGDIPPSDPVAKSEEKEVPKKSASVEDPVQAVTDPSDAVFSKEDCRNIMEGLDSVLVDLETRGQPDLWDGATDSSPIMRRRLESTTAVELLLKKVGKASETSSGLLAALILALMARLDELSLVVEALEGRIYAETGKLGGGLSVLARHVGQVREESDRLCGRFHQHMGTQHSEGKTSSSSLSNKENSSSSRRAKPKSSEKSKDVV